MSQIPVLSGIATDGNAEFRTAYPVNLIPVPKISGVSQGYLRPADGIVLHGTGPGVDRGGINWDGVCYRVMGSNFVSVASDGTVTTIGSVDAGSDTAKFDYSFDRLAIVCGGNAYYYNGGALSRITDTDLGIVFDVKFVDGYFMFTDGTFLVITELNDPTSIAPLKYGSAETDPDATQGVLKVRN